MKSILKRMICVTMLGMIALLLSLAISASTVAEGTCGEALNWILTDDNTLTISGSGVMEDFKAGGAPWDMYELSIKKVVIGDEVTNVGAYAFYESVILEEVILGKNVTAIGMRAFSKCSVLRTLTVSDNLQSLILSPFSDTFVETVVVPDTAVNISPNLYNLASVEEFHVLDTDASGYYDMDGILYFYDKETDVRTFVKCPAAKELTGTYIVDTGTNIIGDRACQAQSKLEAVVMPETVVEIGVSAFENCESLTTVTVGNKTNVLKLHAFDGTPLSTVILPNTATQLSITLRDIATIEQFVVENPNGSGFYTLDGILYHYDLENDLRTLVKCPEALELSGRYIVEKGIDVIGPHAFENQKLLEGVTFPTDVNKISEYAFNGCELLMRVYFYGEPPELEYKALPEASTGILLCYVKDTAGWTNPWNKYTTSVFVEKVGDMNNDGMGDSGDAQIMTHYFAGWINEVLDSIHADIDNDGSFTRRDMMIFIRYLFGWEGYDEYFKNAPGE